MKSSQYQKNPNVGLSCKRLSFNFQDSIGDYCLSLFFLLSLSLFLSLSLSLSLFSLSPSRSLPLSLSFSFFSLSLSIWVFSLPLSVSSFLLFSHTLSPNIGNEPHRKLLYYIICVNFPSILVALPWLESEARVATVSEKEKRLSSLMLSCAQHVLYNIPVP